MLWWKGNDRLDTIFDELSLGGGDLSEEAVKLKELLSDFGDVFALSDAASYYRRFVPIFPESLPLCIH